MNSRISLAIFAMLAAGIFSVAAQSNVTSAPVYVPDVSHQNDPLPGNVLAFDAGLKSVDAFEGTDFARFTFSFTNIWTNIVTILDVKPSCGCTTVELPPLPWQLAPGSNGEVNLKINLAGKMGMFVKTAHFKTDRGQRDLMLRVNMTPPPPMKISDAERAQQMAAAKVDRQAVFKGDCASCHTKNVEGRFGQELFHNACAICHEAENRATMVPDLAGLKSPTNVEFWRTWITYGKPGSLMPAFAQSQGGPLTDMQIASLAQFLNTAHPSNATNSLGN